MAKSRANLRFPGHSSSRREEKMFPLKWNKNLDPIEVQINNSMYQCMFVVITECVSMEMFQEIRLLWLRPSPRNARISFVAVSL